MTIGEDSQNLKAKDSPLIKIDTAYNLQPSEGGRVLQVVMDPKLKERAFKHLEKDKENNKS